MPKLSVSPAGFVSVLVVVLFGGALFLMLYRPIVLDEKQSQLVNIMVGFLGGAFTTAVQYWLGSSASARKKDETISAIATGTGTGAGT